MMRASEHSARHAGRDAGFTLIELLVSLMLLAMIMALVPSTLRLAKRAWETAAELDGATNTGAGVTFLEARLAEAMPLFESDADGALKVAFTGTSQSLRFVAPLANGPQGGGLYRMDLGVIAGVDGDSKSVALRIFPYDSKSTGAVAIEERQLLENLGAVRFRYFGATPESTVPLWSDTWTKTDRLPDLVEVSLGDRDGAARPIKIELRLRRRD